MDSGRVGEAERTAREGQGADGKKARLMECKKYLIAGVGALALVTAAPASIIELSDFSSDETDAGLLSATMEFTIAGTTLTLTVTNNTSGLDSYKMNELYFNAPDGVTLAFSSLPGWTFSTGAGANGFGIFAFALIDGQGGNPNQTTAGETVSFSFTILTGPPSMSDFVDNFSTVLPGMTPMIVAAKFVGGPGDDSAYGAAIPSPGVLALLAAAGLVSGRRRRRRG